MLGTVSTVLRAGSVVDGMLINGLGILAVMDRIEEVRVLEVGGGRLLVRDHRPLDVKAGSSARHEIWRLVIPGMNKAGMHGWLGGFGLSALDSRYCNERLG